MSRTVSLADVIAAARELAEAKGESGENWTDDVALTAKANESLGLWWGMVTQAEPERFADRQSITITGATSYNLPTDFLADLVLRYTRGSESVDIPRVMLHEQTAYSGSSSSSIAGGYYIEGDLIYLCPPPTSGTYTLIYVPHAPVLVEAADSFNGVNGWEAWLNYDLAIWLLEKERDSTTSLREKQSEIEAKIRSAARKRSLANARRIVDVGPKRYSWRYGRRFSW